MHKNMKFVCLTMWLGEVCTDDANANTNANDDNAQFMIVLCSFVEKPNEPIITVKGPMLWNNLKIESKQHDTYWIKNRSIWTRAHLAFWYKIS